MAAKKISSVYTELRARLDKYEKDLAKAKGVTNKAATNMQNRVNKLSFDKATASLTKFLGAFSAIYGFKVFTGFMMQNIELAASWERGLLRTEALIRSTGGAAGFSAQELADFATELDKATLFDKRGFIDAINVMQTFRKIHGETFKQAIRLSADLAEINQTSVKSTAMQLAKLLEAPDRLLSSLTRSGIIFDKSQENLIKSLVKSNRLLEAQRIILDKIQKEVGGAATGAGGGLAGKIDLLTFSWGQLRESLSNTQIAATAIDAITAAVDRLTKSINSGELKNGFKFFFENFVPLGVGLKKFEQLKEAAKDYFQYFADLENNVVRKKVPEGQKTIVAKKIPIDQNIKPILDANEKAAEAAKQHELQIKKLTDAYIASLPVINTYIDSWQAKGERTFTDEQLEKSIQLKNAYDSLLTKRIDENLSDVFGDVDKAYDELSNKSEETFNTIMQLSERTAWAMQENFSDVFYDAMKGELNSFKDYFKAFLDSIQRAWADIMGQMATEWIFGSEMKGGGILSQAAGFVGSLFGGVGGGSGATSLSSARWSPRAIGGPVTKAKSYLVGERGPELFVPDTDGNVNNLKTINSPTTVTNNYYTYQITANDAASFVDMARRSGAVPILAAENLNANGILRQAVMENK